MNENYIIRESKDVALAALNQEQQYPDKVNIIYYYTDEGNIDFLYAIGVSEGTGPQNYSIIQSKEEELVTAISDQPSDVTTLIHGEIVLVYHDSKWYKSWDLYDETIDEYVRQFEEITTPGIYRNLDDGFRWFFSNGILKREDDFLSGEETSRLVGQNIEYFKRPILEITLYLPINNPTDVTQKGNSWYLSDNVSDIEKPKFSIRVIDYSGTDVTSNYEIGLDDEYTIIYIPEEEKYMVWGSWESDFVLHITATRNHLKTVQEVKVWFPKIAYWGSCVVGNNTITTRTINSKLVYHDLTDLILNYELNNERSILFIPQEFQRFYHIYDKNGLDYIQNYTYINSYEFRDATFQVYYKNEPIIQEDLEQRFLYSDEVYNNVDIFSGDFYTKEEVDSNFAPIAKGVPSGGSVGQVLTKCSSVNDDVEWRDVTVHADEIQSDWNQTSTYSASYIANKPAIKSGTAARSIKEGDISNNVASGDYSHAEGHGTSASGIYSHTEGNNTTASGYVSHAEGESTTSSNNFSHAEGASTVASGNTSHAEGGSTTASGAFSHAEGCFTTASNDYEHAEGHNNVSHTGSTLADKTRHSIGIGSGNANVNALEIMANGDMYVYGVGGYDGTNIASVKTLQQLINYNGNTPLNYFGNFGVSMISGDYTRNNMLEVLSVDIARSQIGLSVPSVDIVCSVDHNVQNLGSSGYIFYKFGYSIGGNTVYGNTRSFYLPVYQDNSEAAEPHILSIKDRLIVQGLTSIQPEDEITVYLFVYFGDINGNPNNSMSMKDQEPNTSTWEIVVYRHN